MRGGVSLADAPIFLTQSLVPQGLDRKTRPFPRPPFRPVYDDCRVATEGPISDNSDNSDPVFSPPESEIPAGCVNLSVRRRD
jgi:hypothetical protein